jgi:Domain of unknown function (DUF4829)
MKKISTLTILLVMFSIFAGCTKESSTDVDAQKVVEGSKIEVDTPDAVEDSNTDVNTPEAQKVVEDYFKYMQEKKQEKLDALFYRKSHGDYGFSNLKEIKLLSIKENKRKISKESFVTHGNGQVYGTKMSNVILYDVTYEVKFKDDNYGPLTSGTQADCFAIIRDDKKDSSWLIGDVGHC